MTKKVTAKDLAMYVGLPCAIYDGGDPVSHYIEGVDIYLDKVICERANYEPEQIKPILRKLEDIKVSESVHISCNIMGYDQQPEKYKKWNDNDKLEIREFGMIQFDTQHSVFMPAIIDYLIKQGFNLHLLPHGSYLEVDARGFIDLRETKI